ncbi:MAG: proline racemase family protein [Planctomycetales bacterium]|nr:proline racemase family protein [Planctomycetales bacterium]
MDVIDSHTGGEPTRVVVAGGPDLGVGSLADKRERFREEFDHLRSAIVNEPRGNDAIVGALICEPYEPDCVCGVIFFNNVGCINMCVHGTIGLAVTLAHLSRVEPGTHRLDTPVGVVEFQLEDDHLVSVANVPSYRATKQMALEVADYGTLHGDIAWGGNWFFLCDDHGQRIEFDNLPRLTECAWRIRHALEREGITGADGGVIDHIELFGPYLDPSADSKNFVLCPGGAYDRSPCGTGTSAKVACLLADGKLQPNEVWRQESIVGSIFEASGSVQGDRILPRIRGSAFVTAEARLILDSSDPFCAGFRS